MKTSNLPDLSPRLDYQSLWQSTLDLARRAYGYNSERQAHELAARDIAIQNDLKGTDLALWNEFVNRKLTRMSNRTGD